ncbi:MAG: glycoside hydrolase family 2 TIM barrel-domain containing protein, partial [Mucilaginibacter sp.]
PYGYTSFYYNITRNLKFGEKNTIAVEVKNEGQNSRWYSGSGIYRHVWLKTLTPVHVAQWGTFITTPSISEKSASVSIKTKLVNEGTSSAEISLITTIINDKGAETGKTESKLTLSAGEQKEIKGEVEINGPQLWSCESPSLYKAITQIYQYGQLVGREENTFGIRKITFDVEKGFQLNGKTVKLKGGCFHNDNGPLGSKAYDRAEERKVELLKASGYNAVRCSHNPPSPAFLDACDRLGMLVMDEAFDMWNKGKNPYDYHLYFKEWWQRDLESMVMRDRNHPGIIMWSIGNEIPERGEELGVKTSEMLVKAVKNLDPTRAVTAAVNDLTPDKDPYFATLDVSGYNYAVFREGGADVYEKDHQRVPTRIMVGTESMPMQAFGSWDMVQKHPYVIGDFVWTAWDYIGEASIGWRGYPQNNDFYPWNLAFCGDIDICGWKRPQSYYRDALWKADQLAVFVKSPLPSFKESLLRSIKWNWVDVVAGWNWKGYENKPLEINVYSSCERVELFLNNRSLGTKVTNRSTKFIASWIVPYQAGELKAIGYSGDKPVQTSVLRTADKPAKTKLTADNTQLKADGQDLSYITVELTDSKGRVNPNAINLVKFSVKGDAQIVGVGNGNPMSLESSQLPQRKAWKGKCLVIIKAGKTPGKITVSAQSAGLSSSTVSLNSKIY